ncbi:MAG: hypothetical protein H6923_00955 [Alphaproteobacteria bacterium]|nr:hypothetical protein [Alphaproteobacteria bacterium]
MIESAIVIRARAARIEDDALVWEDEGDTTRRLPFSDIVEIVVQTTGAGASRKSEIRVTTRDGRVLLLIEDGKVTLKGPGAGELARALTAAVSAANPSVVIRTGVGAVGALFFLLLALAVIGLVVGLVFVVVFFGLLWAAIGVALFSVLALPRILGALLRRWRGGR